MTGKRDLFKGKYLDARRILELTVASSVEQRGGI
jgi:hypothetical protein